MHAYELLVFDFDGTLVDTLADIAHHVNGALGELGFAERSLAEVRRAVGRGVHELLKSLEPRLAGEPARLERAVISFKERYRHEPVIHAKPYDGIPWVFEKFLGGHKKAIVTNKPSDITELILEKLSLKKYFELRIGLDSGYPPKPNPDAVRYVMDRLKVPRQRTLLIGDGQVDYLTAVNASVDFGWAQYGYDELGAGSHMARRYTSPRQWRELQRAGGSQGSSNSTKVEV